MGKKQDLTGQTINRWTFIRRDPSGRQIWLCRCSCGTERLVRSANIKNGSSKSCGCHNLEQLTFHGHAKKHGQRTSTYSIWQNIKGRCLNPKDTTFKFYGAKGIQVCTSWQESFSNFLADMGERPEGKTLDRINPLGDYEPGNCRWATSKEQNRNTTRNFIIEYNGESHCLSEWAEIYSMPKARLASRLKAGWSFELATSKPPIFQGPSRIISLDGVSYSTSELAKKFNISSKLLSSRLDNGWDIVRALNQPKQEHNVHK